MTHVDDEKQFPTPAVNAGKTRPKSLDLTNVDVSKSGVTGGVAISKGEASTFVTTIPDPKRAAEDNDL
jgi:hypothetical protein